jgi:hypothetical protein
MQLYVLMLIDKIQPHILSLVTLVYTAVLLLYFQGDKCSKEYGCLHNVSLKGTEG